MLHFTQADRAALLGTRPRFFRKTARIVAVQIPQDFTVETGAGDMRGEDGDWLVTNHPDDDSGSDVWSISDERMRATYEELARP